MLKYYKGRTGEDFLRPYKIMKKVFIYFVFVQNLYCALDFEKSIKELKKVPLKEISYEEKIKEVEKLKPDFLSAMGKVDLTKKNCPELYNLSDSLYNIITFSYSDKAVERMEKVFEKLLEKRCERVYDISNIYDALIISGNFDKAYEVSINYLWFNSVILTKKYEVIKNSSSSYFYPYYEITVSSLVYKDFDPKKYSLLIFASPNCHFSKSALDFFEKDPFFSVFFSTSDIFVYTTDTDIKNISVWNEKHKLKINFTRYSGNWKNFLASSSPTFIFLENGAPVLIEKGWFKDKTPEILKNLFLKKENFLEYGSKKLLSYYFSEEPDRNLVRKNYAEILLFIKNRVMEKGVENLTDEELKSFWRVYYIYLSNDKPEKEYDFFKKVLEEIKKRNLLSAKLTVEAQEIAFVFEDLFLARELYEYNKNARNVIKINEIIDKSGGSGRKFYFFDEKDNIIIKNADIKGDKIIFGGICHINKKAYQSIYGDDKLSKYFKKYSVFLTDNPYNAYAWNKKNKDKFYVIYEKKNWSEFDFRATPVFYFLKNGKIINSFTGWTGDEDKQKIVYSLWVLGVL